MRFIEIKESLTNDPWNSDNYEHTGAYLNPDGFIYFVNKASNMVLTSVSSQDVMFVNKLSESKEKEEGLVKESFALKMVAVALGNSDKVSFY